MRIINKNLLLSLAKGLFIFLCFLAIWHFAVVWLKIKVFILPSPLKVMDALFDPKIAARHNWPRHISATGQEVVFSFFITFFVGVGLAILIVWSKLLRKLLMPVVLLFNSIPKICLAPIFIIWFGYGIVPNIIVAVIIAFLPVVINTATGLEAVEDDLLDLVHYLDASKAQVFLKIRIPNSLPFIFAGLKISAALCVAGAIVGEFIASSRGLGYLLRDAQAFIDTPTIFACLFLLSFMGMILFSSISALEKIIMPWNNKAQGVENR